MIKFLPTLFGIFSRAKTLQGALKSRTTRDQWTAVVIASVAVAALQAVYPMEPGIAEAATLTAVALCAPLVVRMMRYVAPSDSVDTVPDDILENADIYRQLIRVMRRNDQGWRMFSGTILDARIEGWNFGYDAAGTVFDLDRVIKTGEVVRIREEGNPDDGVETDAEKKYKQIIDAVKRHKVEK